MISLEIALINKGRLLPSHKLDYDEEGNIRVCYQKQNLIFTQEEEEEIISTSMQAMSAFLASDFHLLSRIAIKTFVPSFLRASPFIETTIIPICANVFPDNLNLFKDSLEIILRFLGSVVTDKCSSRVILNSWVLRFRGPVLYRLPKDFSRSQ